MFANARPSGEPMVTPSICRYMLLLKLNSTEEVASCINSTKMSRRKDGFRKTLLLCRASAQVCMVSARGTLVKRLEMSKEQRKTEEGEKVKFLTSSAKVKESDTQLADRSLRTGWRRQVSHLASSCWADLVIDRIGRKGASFLWVFGRPYMHGRWEPVGRIALYNIFEINFSLFSCSNRRCICASILAVLSLLVAGPRSRNLVVSFRTVIILSLYSFLLRITTPDPLSGFVMMMSSLIQRDLIAWKHSFVIKKSP